MDNKNWQNAFGTPTEIFRKQLHDALNDLEEKKMKKRYKITTVLLAAVIAAALIASAGFAASRLRIFESLGFDPLEGSEEMVLTDLGSVENDLVKMTVLEAVYDGHNSIVELLITPKDPDNYVLFDDMLNPWTDEYIIEETPKEMPEGKNSFMIDGEGKHMPTPTYEKDGKTYYADITDKRVVGRKDDKIIIDYWPVIKLDKESGYAADSWGTGTLFDSMHAEEQSDGSMILWCTDTGSNLVRSEMLELLVGLGISVDGEKSFLDSIPVTLVKAEDERVVDLVPIEDGKIKDFQLIDAEIRFTRIQGYFSMNYYEWVPYCKWIDFYFYDEQGNEIRAAGAGGEEEELDENCSKVFWYMEMQPLEEIPKTLYLEARVRNDDEEEVLGRVECRVIERN